MIPLWKLQLTVFSKVHAFHKGETYKPGPYAAVYATGERPRPVSSLMITKETG
jgi:hypothetical protein